MDNKNKIKSAIKNNRSMQLTALIGIIILTMIISNHLEKPTIKPTIESTKQTKQDMIKDAYTKNNTTQNQTTNTVKTDKIEQNQTTADASPAKNKPKIHKLIKTPYQSKSINQAIEQATTLNEPIPKNTTTAILPHHALVNQIIADFLKTLAKTNQPDTIIIIGPNHKDAGPAKIAIADIEWQSEWGTLNPNQEIIAYLQETQLAIIDNQTITDEHSITAILPFIATYFPNTKIVPIILKSTTHKEDAIKLADSLTKTKNQNILILGSIDFSHYKTSQEADEYDKLTIQAINTHDYNQIATMKSENIDSPATLITILKTAEKQNKPNTKIYIHTNSAKYTKTDPIKTTSYIITTNY